MAIAKGAYASAETGSASTTFDLTTLAVGTGSNMAIYVCINVCGSGDNVIDVTYDPGGGDEVALTLVDVETGLTGGLAGEMSVWRLLDADIIKSSTKTIRVTCDDLTRFGIVAQVYTGVDQGSPEDTPSSSVGTNANGSVTMNITSSAGDIVLGFASVYGESAVDWDSGNNMTEVDSGLPQNVSIANVDQTVGDDATGGTVPLRITWDISTRPWGVIGLNINQAGAGSVMPLFMHHYDE